MPNHQVSETSSCILSIISLTPNSSDLFFVVEDQLSHPFAISPPVDWTSSLLGILSSTGMFLQILVPPFIKCRENHPFYGYAVLDQPPFVITEFELSAHLYVESPDSANHSSNRCSDFSGILAFPTSFHLFIGSFGALRRHDVDVTQ